MKTIYYAFLLIFAGLGWGFFSPLFGADSAMSNNMQNLSQSGRKDDFENITQRFQIRNLRNGIAINLERRGDLNTQNWFLRDFGLDPDFMRGKDPLAKSWNFGYVQFVDPRDNNRCLSIGEDGFLHYTSCSGDIQSGKFESIFSLIPTKNGAVQIRSLVLKGDECLSTFENPQVPIERRFGISPCSLDFDFLIDTSELFYFAPALVNSRPLAR